MIGDSPFAGNWQRGLCHAVAQIGICRIADWQSAGRGLPIATQQAASLRYMECERPVFGEIGKRADSLPIYDLRFNAANDKSSSIVNRQS